MELIPRELRVTNAHSRGSTGSARPWTAVLLLCPADYEKEIKACSEATFTYTDEDDGETVTLSPDLIFSGKQT